MSHHHHLVQLAAGEDPRLNGKEYLLQQAYHHVLEKLADTVNLDAEDADSALADLDHYARLYTGMSLYNLLSKYHADVAQLGYTEADGQLVRRGITMDMRPIRPELINSLTDDSVSSLQYITGDMKSRLAMELQEGYAIGEGIPDLRDRVMGVLDVSKNSATRLARTMTNEVYNQAHIQRYQDAGVQAVQFSAANNEKTCDYCASLDGMIWRIDDPDIIRPPVHFNCRCRLLPWLGDIPDSMEVSQDVVDAYNDFHDKYWDVSADAIEPATTSDIAEQQTQEPEISYVPSGSIAEAEQKAVDMGVADKAMFKGLSVEQADDIVQAMADYKTIAPKALDNLDYVGTSQEINKAIARLKAEAITQELRSKGASDSFIQYYIKQYAKPKRVEQNVIADTIRVRSGDNVVKLGVGVNKNLVTSDGFEASLARDVESGFHPLGTDTLKAQIDHEMGHVITDTYNVADDPEFNTFYNELAAHPMEISTGLSRYATYSKDEFIGEAWSEYLNNPNPRPIAQRTGQIIEGIIARSKR